MLSGVARFAFASLAAMAHRLQARSIVHILTRDRAVGQAFVPTLVLITGMEDDGTLHNPDGLLDNVRPVVVAVVVAITVNNDWHN